MRVLCYRPIEWSLSIDLPRFSWSFASRSNFVVVTKTRGGGGPVGLASGFRFPNRFYPQLLKQIVFIDVGCQILSLFRIAEGLCSFRVKDGIGYPASLRAERLVSARGIRLPAAPFVSVSFLAILDAIAHPPPPRQSSLLQIWNSPVS